jgi:hypothetical protein
LRHLRRLVLLVAVAAVCTLVGVPATSGSAPQWAPTAVGVPTSLGAKVYSYGNSSLRGGVTQLSPKYGVSLGNTAGWSTKTYTLTPAIPGDSGSGFLDAQGRAIGVLSTVELAPLAGSNNFGDLGRELTYLHGQAGFAAVSLVAGTQPFQVPITG